MVKIFIVSIDLNRGEDITAEVIRGNILQDLYDSPVTVKEIV